MKVEFDCKVSKKAMYNFMMYHSYHSFSGIFSIVAGAALLAYFAWNQSQGGDSEWLFLFFGVLFLVYQPWALFMSASKQVTLNPMFKRPLSYCLSEEGITVRQEETENELPWSGITKVCETSQSILVYTNKKNAFIWVKDQMGAQEPAVRKMLSEKASGKMRRFERKM